MSGPSGIAAMEKATAELEQSTAPYTQIVSGQTTHHTDERTTIANDESRIGRETPATTTYPLHFKQVLGLLCQRGSML